MVPHKDEGGANERETTLPVTISKNLSPFSSDRGQRAGHSFQIGMYIQISNNQNFPPNKVPDKTIKRAKNTENLHVGARNSTTDAALNLKKTTSQ